ncbi:MAG: beta-ketoacyl-[acyl-carrier-protein] synthase family protein [Verrucomicrobia bacterium]|nr:beta-ketoacyl-[acyl-carrier-protein] synthase family protein [Verrucomicrobiota bacterium]MBV9272722.1 beta-ketoacyl-[acyl-carrier-protein] synthase family protein [Verrucomicrobiota bacterium]
MRRVVVTGLGPITPIGVGKEAFWQGILAGKSSIDYVSRFDPDLFNAKTAAEIRQWEPGRYFPPHRLKRLDRYAQFAVTSAKLALDDSGLSFSPDNPQDRIGVSFGSALGGVSNAEQQHVSFVNGGPKSVHQTIALQVFGGSAHCNIAIEFGFRGIGTTNSNSCASGNVAIGEGFRYIRDGFVDVVVAGGAEAPLSPLSYGAFAFIRTMSRQKPSIACRPFDLNRDGFVMGEGAASLILEEYEHAKARGAPIYAEIAGYSLNNDAFHMTTPLPTGDSCIRAMRDALAMAQLNPDEVDYVNAHASSTQLNDASECACIKAVFGSATENLPVSGTKAFYGHPLGASAAIEGVLCALALTHSYIPPTLNFETPDPACDIEIVPNQGREQALRNVLSNAFGFGGINSCVVFKKL